MVALFPFVVSVPLPSVTSPPVPDSAPITLEKLFKSNVAPEDKDTEEVAERTFSVRARRVPAEIVVVPP